MTYTQEDVDTLLAITHAATLRGLGKTEEAGTGRLYTQVEVEAIVGIVEEGHRASMRANQNLAAAIKADRERAITGEPVAWHVNHHGSCQIYTRLEGLDLTDCKITPLYAAPITGETSRDVAAEGGTA